MMRLAMGTHVVVTGHLDEYRSVADVSSSAIPILSDGRAASGFPRNTAWITYAEWQPARSRSMSSIARPATAA
jgi:hypothetical protein